MFEKKKKNKTTSDWTNNAENFRIRVSSNSQKSWGKNNNNKECALRMVNECAAYRDCRYCQNFIDIDMLYV